jgi:hypothetical protein
MLRFVCCVTSSTRMTGHLFSDHESTPICNTHSDTSSLTPLRLRQHQSLLAKECCRWQAYFINTAKKAHDTNGSVLKPSGRRGRNEEDEGRVHLTIPCTISLQDKNVFTIVHDFQNQINWLSWLRSSSITLHPQKRTSRHSTSNRPPLLPSASLQIMIQGSAHLYKLSNLNRR